MREDDGPGGGRESPAGTRRLLLPDLLWEGGRFRPGRAVEVDEGTGRIVGVVPAEGPAGAAGGPVGDGPDGGGPDGGRVARSSGMRSGEATAGRPTVERLEGRALLPGFVNAHSHAFQRLLRGRTQWRPAEASEADFWSWREAMYGAAGGLSPEELFSVSRWCFIEMLRAGYTAVGEFHYLHRDPEGRAYRDPNELATRVLEAAGTAGIRIVLLNACYAAGGIGEPLRPEQARFATPDLDGFLAATEALMAAVRSDPLRSVGLAPHSVRAVPREWLAPLGEWAAERSLPLHMHLCEQPGEVEACRSAHGLGPAELAAEEGLLNARFVGVHLTHASAREARLLGEAEATACLCPTTERDLGDGVPPAGELLEAGVALAIGSDSQTIVDPLEEVRLVEYHERLRRLRRVLFATAGPSDERLEAGPRLLEFGTAAGARALGIAAGRITPGAGADLVAVDLRHPALAGWTAETLASFLALAAPSSVVSDVWVGGARRVEERRHPGEEEALEGFREVAGRIS